MANPSLPQTLAPTTFKQNVEKAKNAPKTNLGKDVEGLASKHGEIKWELLDHTKVTSAADIATRIAAIEEQVNKNVAALKTQAKAVETSADAFTKAAGKDFDKAAMTAVNAMKRDASGLHSEAQKKFDAAIKELELKAKNAPKAAGKQAAPAGGAVNKADELLLIKLSKKAVAAAMRPKPGVKPPMFAIVGKKGGALKVLMGTKTEVAKLQGKYHKPDPTTKKKPPLARDPQSQLLFENGALVFVSAKIDKGFISGVKRALKDQIKKSPKLKWRKPGAPDVEAEGGGEDLKAEDVQVADEKVDPREQMAAQGNYKSMQPKVKAAMAPALKGRSPADTAEINDTYKEAEQAAAKGDFVEALSLLEAVEGLLDASPEDEDEGGAEADTGAATPAAKSAADAATPAAKSAAAAPAGAAAKGPDLSGLGSQLSSNVKEAFDGIDKLARAIVAMYPAAQRPPNLTKAVEDLKTCQSKLKGYDFQSALKGVSSAKDAGDRAKMLQEAQQSLKQAQAFVSSDKIMQTLDNHGVEGVGNLTAAAKLKETLEKIEAQLH